MRSMRRTLIGLAVTALVAVAIFVAGTEDALPESTKADRVAVEKSRRLLLYS